MPVFHTDKLVHYSSIMHRCSETLMEKLMAAAEKKESLDIAPLIQVRKEIELRSLFCRERYAYLQFLFFFFCVRGTEVSISDTEGTR